MASKTDESSDETSRENASSYSVNDLKPTIKSTTCEIGQRTASEASNLVSVNSSHDSLSENTAKPSFRSDDVRDSDKRNLTVKCENVSLEGHDDNISCVSRANEPTKTIPSQSAFGCLDSKDDIEISQNKSIRQSTYSDGDIQKVHPPISLSTDVSTHNSGLMDNPSAKVKGNGAGAGAGPLNVQLKEEPPECTKVHLSSLQTKEVISGTLSGASYACPNIQDSEAGLDGGNSVGSMKICPKLTAQTDNDACIFPAEASNSVKLNQEVDKVKASLVLHDAKETSSQSHPVDESDESDIVEQDVSIDSFDSIHFSYVD